ncbi:NAD-dependent epimerase/dehydratase family protein [Microbacterium proteolyticum]|uniref:NAD-dependent epimerase/dehydratase family protein n=1 Tax=Microbacterium proteolyticum TaxID=1572644 RepID=UPI0035C216F9
MNGENTWVIGRGLLGRAVERARGVGPTPRPIRWSQPDEALEDLRHHAASFAGGTGDIEIYWCAGRGVTSTPASELEAEVDLFRRALVVLRTTLPHRRILFFLASSVGGAYAMSPAPPFTEQTPEAPGSAYGLAKLAMESAVREHARSAGWRVFIARITNLYGPGQDMAKGQGLISVITDSFVRSSPVSLYVSLDTLRDYIYEDDCARVIVGGMARLRDEPNGRTVTKIVGAMSAISIGALLGEVTRLRRQRSQIMLGQGRSTGQASDLRVRSVIWTDLDALVRTTLPEGLDKVFRARLGEHSVHPR